MRGAVFIHLVISDLHCRDGQMQAVGGVAPFLGLRKVVNVTELVSCLDVPSCFVMSEGFLLCVMQLERGILDSANLQYASVPSPSNASSMTSLNVLHRHPNLKDDFAAHFRAGLST